jgi:hypothetical protein
VLLSECAFSYFRSLRPVVEMNFWSFPLTLTVNDFSSMGFISEIQNLSKQVLPLTAPLFVISKNTKPSLKFPPFSPVPELPFSISNSPQLVIPFNFHFFLIQRAEADPPSAGLADGWSLPFIILYIYNMYDIFKSWFTVFHTTMKT